jgi:quercetin dioxygenase-like cupin family protein
MKRVAVLAFSIVAVSGSAVVLAAPSGVSRVVLAKGAYGGDVNIQAKGPVQVTHGIANIEPGGTTGWISWPGTVVATMRTGQFAYRNAAEQDCAERTVSAGESFIVPAETVFQNVNTSSDTAEVHFVAFLSPGQKVKAEEQPANC